MKNAVKNSFLFLLLFAGANVCVLDGMHPSKKKEMEGENEYLQDAEIYFLNMMAKICDPMCTHDIVKDGVGAENIIGCEVVSKYEDLSNALNFLTVIREDFCGKGTRGQLERKSYKMEICKNSRSDLRDGKRKLIAKDFYENCCIGFSEISLNKNRTALFNEISFYAENAHLSDKVKSVVIFKLPKKKRRSTQPKKK